MWLHSFSKENEGIATRKSYLFLVFPLLNDVILLSFIDKGPVIEETHGFPWEIAIIFHFSNNFKIWKLL